MFQLGGTLQGAAELQRLRGVEKLYGQHGFHVVYHPHQLGGAVGPHRNVVFLALGRRDGIAGGGPAQPLVLGHDAGGRVLRNHKAAVEAGRSHQVLRKAAETVDELEGAALRDAGQFAHSDGQGIHRNGDGLSVEVAGRYHHILVREDIGVVRGGIDLVLDDGLDIHNIVFHRSVHLRDAAEAVGILHVHLGPVDEFAPFQDLHEGLSRENLPGMGPKLMGEGKEGLDAAVISVQGHGADNIGPGAQAHALEDAPDGMGAHKLRAVQKGQAFLALQLDGLPALFFPHFGRGPDLSLIEDLSHSDEREAQMRQGGEVSGGTQGALLVHHRQHVFVEHVHQALDGGQLRSGVAVGEVLHLQKEHQLHNLRLYGFSGSAGVGHHQVVLELAQVFLRDGYVIEGAEASGYPVDGAVQVFHFLVQVCPAFDNGVYGFLRQGEFFVVVQDFFHSLQGEMGVGYTVH